MTRLNTQKRLFSILALVSPWFQQLTATAVNLEARNIEARAVAATTFTDSTTNVVYTAQGCYYDSQTTRTLTVQSNTPASTAMTPALCAAACYSQGYYISGTEYGQECWCGPTLPASSLQVAAGSCATVCSGTTAYYCGGPGALTVFSSPPQYTTSSLSYVSYIGCGTASGPGTTVVAYTTSATASIEECAKLTYATGYRSFSLTLNAGAVKCSMYSNLVTVGTAGTCTNVCPGNPNQYCGSTASSTTGSLFGVVTPLVAASVHPASVTAATGVTYNRVAFQVDTSSARVLSVAMPIASLTPTACVTACYNAGYSYAGVENGIECYCGNALASSTAATQTSFNTYNGCTTACSGSATLPCGGPGCLVTYQLSGGTNPGAVANFNTYKGNPVSYANCYADSASSRLLSNRATIASSTLTPTTCATWCATNNYAYAGLEYGVECWCGNSVSGGTTISKAVCATMPCPGLSTAGCGSGNALMVYTIGTAPVSTVGAFGTFAPIACYSDASGSARILNNYYYTDAALTVETCLANCFAMGFAYAGVENGNQCFCANAIKTSPTVVSTCTTACAGASTEYCGGSNAIIVYSTGATGPVIASGLTAAGAVMTGDVATAGNVLASSYATGSAYKGCYTDSLTSRLWTFQAPLANSNLNTPQLCVDTCASLAYAYAGVQYGQECWCSATLPAVGLLAKIGDCNMPCSGNSAVSCGAGNRMAIYQVGTLTSTWTNNMASPSGYAYQGCYTDSITGRVLTTTISSVQSSQMSPANCAAACLALGMPYSGVEYGIECYCGSKLQSSVTSTNCVMPCALASSNNICGGGNAISVYYNSGLVRTGSIATLTAGGQTWNYKACWGEPGSGRALPNPINNSPVFTIQSCLTAGANAGYNACGLEYGGECWCATLTAGADPAGGQIPEAFCTTNGMACKGAATNNCGAGNVLAYYSTIAKSYTAIAPLT